jgi:pimeloyl-ACP methyl ester carboxylesterase
MQEHDVASADGTRIRVWRTRHHGPPVLLCPGLGTVPESWPALLLPAGGVTVHSWYDRGTMGSQRPADPTRIGVPDSVSDALAVLDDAGVRRCVVAGWSMGVTVAAELALRHPERVSGLMLIGGAPGDALAAVLGVPGLPEEVRRLIGVGGARALRAAGPLLNGVLPRVPVNDVTTFLLRHSGLLLPSSAPDAVAASISRFLTHDWSWYFTLALALGRWPAQDLSGLTCPVTVIAGRFDVLASAGSVARSIGALPQARFRRLAAGHFLPLEAPDVVVEELALLQERVDAVERVLTGAEPAPRRARTAPARRALTSRSRHRA